MVLKRALLGFFVVLGIGAQSLCPASIAAQCVHAPSGLTHWWPGDGDTSDIVGRRDATLQGDATFDEGWVDEAFLLDGDGDFVSVPDHPGLNVGTAAFTVDLWVRFDTTQGEQVMIEKYVETTVHQNRTGWSLTKLPNNMVQLAITADARINSAPLTLSLDKWIFFAVRRSGSTFTVFKDGLAIAVGTSAATLNSPSSLKFGHRGNPGDTPGSEDPRNFFLDGSIDEVELFGRALSNAEIRKLYAAGRDGKCKRVARAAPVLSAPYLAVLMLLFAGLGMWRQRRICNVRAWPSLKMRSR